MSLMAAKTAAAALAGVTGVILAGGKSSRMGSNKALLPYRGGLFIESIHRQLSGLFDEVLLVTNTPEQYAFLGCRMVSDIYEDMGALAGLHAGLANSRTPHMFAVACDMPYLNDSLIRALVARRRQGDVIIPESDDGLEPLHAVYCRSCLPAMETALQAGKRRLVSFHPEIKAMIIPGDTVRFVDPHLDSFRNINTPADYYDLRGDERGDCKGHDVTTPDEYRRAGTRRMNLPATG
jgi:molybdopterin-guanine dinucleotide biosynthesis protein A